VVCGVVWCVCEFDREYTLVCASTHVLPLLANTTYNQHLHSPHPYPRTRTAGGALPDQHNRAHILHCLGDARERCRVACRSPPSIRRAGHGTRGTGRVRGAEGNGSISGCGDPCLDIGAACNGSAGEQDFQTIPWHRHIPAHTQIHPSVQVEEDDEEAQRELHSALRTLVQSSPNNMCCECHAPNPTWAECVSGAFVCLRCAGVHRSLGTHVSRVRSIALDAWTQAQVQAMAARGNAVVQQELEAALPQGFVRPDSREGAEAFIRAKYLNRAYAKSAA
jgi:hypothetical protein